MPIEPRWQPNDLREVFASAEALATYGACSPLVAVSGVAAQLLVIRPTAGGLNLPPEPGGPVGVQLYHASALHWSRLHLPASLEYRSLAFSGDPRRHDDQVVIVTDSGTTVTHLAELHRHFPTTVEVPSEQALLTAFAGLENRRVAIVARAPVSTHVLQSESLGTLREAVDMAEYWHAASRDIPVLRGFCDGEVPHVLPQHHPDLDPGFLAELDAAMARFFSLCEEDRRLLGERVLRNCHDYLELVADETDDWAAPMFAVTDPDGIWPFVRPQEVWMERGPYGRVYVVIACNCDWEEEHGLQIVYADGAVIHRVSAQDGHLTEHG